MPFLPNKKLKTVMKLSRTNLLNCFCILCLFNIKFIKIKSRISKVYAFFKRKQLTVFYYIFFCKRPVLIYLHARELFMFFFSSADFLQKEVFKNKPLSTTIRVSNSLDPDQARHSGCLNLGSNCLQKAIGTRQNYSLACKEL